MRKDIFERMKLMKKEGIKPNYAEVARQYGCDYRTVKKYFEKDADEKPTRVYASKLDSFKEIVKEKLAIGCTTFSIYKFIEKQGFKGK